MFHWVQHRSPLKACKTCGSTILRWFPDQGLNDPDAEKPPKGIKCALCIVNLYAEGWRPGEGGSGRAPDNAPSARQEALRDIVEGSQPITVRGVYYLATVAGLVEKTPAGYMSVVGDLKRLRLRGWMPYEWIADNTRGIDGDIDDGDDSDPADDIPSQERILTSTYRMSKWIDKTDRVIIFVEKDALARAVSGRVELVGVPNALKM